MFQVEFLEEAKESLDGLDERSRKKILYNIWKSCNSNDIELFKKLNDNIWEFRTIYNRHYYRLFAFWDKTTKDNTVVISTHGYIKKTGKTPKGEIEHAEKLREKYFIEKSERNENI